MESATYELKYCERCGSLGTRRSDTRQTYCELCEQILSQTFSPAPLRCQPRLRRGKPLAGALPGLKAAAQAACGGMR